MGKASPVDGPIIVRIRGGVYYRSKAFVLAQEDSGTKDVPTVYRAHGNEKVTLRGGREIEPAWTIACRCSNIRSVGGPAVRGAGRAAAAAVFDPQRLGLFTTNLKDR